MHKELLLISLCVIFIVANYSQRHRGVCVCVFTLHANELACPAKRLTHFPKEVPKDPSSPSTRRRLWSGSQLLHLGGILTWPESSFFCLSFCFGSCGASLFLHWVKASQLNYSIYNSTELQPLQTLELSLCFRFSPGGLTERNKPAPFLLLAANLIIHKVSGPPPSSLKKGRNPRAGRRSAVCCSCGPRGARRQTPTTDIQMMW